MVLLRAFVALTCAVAVSGHGSINIPLPRNNDGQYPADTAPGGTTHGPSCLGNACGWFQAGCFIGCPRCSNASSGANVPCYPHTANCTEEDGLLAPTLPDAFRTYNIENKSFYGDWTASHPWRAPGSAPMHDACGLSGAYAVGPGVSGYDPLFPGSQIPAPGGGVVAAAVWEAGGVAEVAWSLWSNHGGGYVYRLCPKNDAAYPSEEECFQKHVLPFADNTTTVRSPYGSFEDFSIPARDVDEGTFPVGSAWRTNPIPACNCDKGYNCTVPADGTKSSPVHYAYDTDAPGEHPCETGFQFPPPWPEGFGYWGSGAHETGDSLLFQLVDRLRVPEEKGEYLLSWRWDCENSPQIWGNCADIVVE